MYKYEKIATQWMSLCKNKLIYQKFVSFINAVELLLLRHLYNKLQKLSNFTVGKNVIQIFWGAKRYGLLTVHMGLEIESECTKLKAARRTDRFLNIIT